jgi:hypothetical protein
LVKRPSSSGKKYEIFKRQKPEVANAWFDYCKEQKIPYVVVEARTKKSDIRFDSISLPEECDAQLAKQARAINHEAEVIFRRYMVKGSKFYSSASLIQFDDIPLDVAELAACDLFDLISRSL